MKSIKIIIIIFSTFLFSSCIINRIDKTDSSLSLIFDEIKYDVVKVGKMPFTNNYGGEGYFISKDSKTKEKGRFFLIKKSLISKNNT